MEPDMGEEVIEMTEEQYEHQTRIRNDPLYFSENFFTINRLPYSAEKFPYADQIYADKSPYVLLLMARSLTKSTIATNKVEADLITNPGISCLASAPTDAQAWRLTKEIFRPNIMNSPEGILQPLILDSDGSDQVGEIDLSNGSKWSAKGAWATGNSLRGPHRHRGILDEFQDWTRTAWVVAREVINLRPFQIILMGTGGLEGSIWHELWQKSDQKEWNGSEWVPQNKNAHKDYSGYHCTQHFSPFETKESVEEKRSDPSYGHTMFTTEVLANFLSAAGVKPAPYETVNKLRIIDSDLATKLKEKVKVTALGIDWGHESKWVLGGITDSGIAVILETGTWGNIEEEEFHRVISPLQAEAIASEKRASKHVRDAIKFIELRKPTWIMCDAGWSHNKNQELMRKYPNQVWAVTTGERGDGIPKWSTRDSDKNRPLPKAQWEYYVDMDHSAMCEHLETRINNGQIWIIDTESSRSVEQMMVEWNMADIVEVESREKIKRKYNISRAHRYAAACYMLIPFMRKKKSILKPRGY